MLGQLITAGLQTFFSHTLLAMISFMLVMLLWLSTVLEFAPIHSKINYGNCDDELLQKLVRKNWQRTIAWTTVCIIDLVGYFVAL